MPPEVLGNFPSLQPTQVALIHVEVDTGIVLDLAGRRYTGTTQRFLVFDTFSDLEMYVQAKLIETPEVECVALDWQQQVIQTYSNQPAIEARLQQRHKGRRAWWQFWNR